MIKTLLIDLLVFVLEDAFGLAVVSERVQQRGELDPCTNQVVTSQGVSPGYRRTVHAELILNP